MTNSKYQRILYIATSVFLVLLGIAFIGCCAHLFFTGGDSPYSRERVGDYLSILLIPSVITILLVIVGAIYDAVIDAKRNDAVKITNREMLASYAPRVDASAMSNEAKSAVQKERDKRENLAWIAGDLSFLFIIASVVYLSLCTSFTVENLNGDVLSALAGLLPLCVGAVVVHIPRIYLAEASAKRELEILRAEVKSGVAISKPVTLTETKREINTVLAVKIAIMVLGIVFVILGIFNGGMDDVLQKAVKICTECIGLG